MVFFDEEEYIMILKKYENKLKELMDPEDFKNFVKDISVQCFAFEVEHMEDEDLKKFIKDNWKAITRW